MLRQHDEPRSRMSSTTAREVDELLSDSGLEETTADMQPTTKAVRQRTRGRSNRIPAPRSNSNGIDDKPVESGSDEDEDKLELERLVLGDDGGFKAGLSMDMDINVDESEEDSGHEDAPESGQDDDENGPDTLDDADVRIRLPVC